MFEASLPARRWRAIWLMTPCQLLKAIKKRSGQTQHQIDQDAVLLRAYGKGTDVLIDRESTWSWLRKLMNLSR